MDIEEHIISILKAFEIEPKPLDRIVAGYLRRHREISASQRRMATDIVFGMARWRRFIDGTLEMQGVKKPTMEDRIRCYEAVANADGFPRAGALAVPDKFPGGDAAYFSFPDFLYSRLVAQFGKGGAREMAARLHVPSLPVVRVNVQRCGRDEIRKKLEGAGIESSPTAVSPFGLRLSRRVNVLSLEIYKEGLIELQDEASQLASILADPGSGATVLDVCAGAGGKALALAMLMGNRGRIIASDIDNRRLSELSRRAKRAQANCIEVVSAEGLREMSSAGQSFDTVLIDAPCTGTGTIRRSPDLKWRLGESSIAERATVQREMLAEYSRWLRPGGRFIYVTCSLLCEENEDVVGDFLRTHDYKIVDAADILSAHGIPVEGVPVADGLLKTDPREGDWDYLFGACLQPNGR